MQNADELIHQIGGLIVMDPAYQDADWDAIALIFDFTGGQKRRNGYLFRGANYWEGSLPKDVSREILKGMLALQDAMEQQIGKKWVKALVQIKRAEESIDIVFEYDDPLRWKANPSNVETIVEEVRS